MSIGPARRHTARFGLGIAYGITAVLVVVIAALTLMPQAPGSPPGLTGADKIAHFLAFAVLVMPLGRARPDDWLWIAIAALTFGASIELIQPQVGRGAEWADFVADAAGVIFGLWVARIGLRHVPEKGSSG